MSTPFESPIIRVTSFLNNCNDDVIAGQPSFPGGSISKYSGQLGKQLFVSHDMIAQLTKASVGTLYGGRFRYVHRRATDDNSPALTPGKIAFWNTTLTNWQDYFEVTTDTNLSSASNAMMRAGIFLNNIEPGNYGFIQDLGEVYVRYRSVLTAAGAIGAGAYAADTADTGSDQGTADSLTTDSTSLANGRFLGWQLEAASAAGLKRVQLAQDAFVQVF